MPHTLGPALTALLPTTCSSLHVESTAQQSMGSAPSKAIVNSSYLQSPTLHVQLAPTEPLQMELPNYQQGSKQLPNTPRSLAPPPPPRIIKLVETHTTSASHTGTSTHGLPAHYLSFTDRRVNGLKHWGQLQWPPIIAPQSTIASFSLPRPTTSETIKPYIPSGEPSTTSGATSSYWSNGNTPTEASSIVESTMYMSTFFSSHVVEFVQSCFEVKACGYW